MASREEFQAAMLELRRRKLLRSEITDATFPQQQAFVKCRDRFVSALTTRRSGKTTGLAYKYFNNMKQNRNVMLPYISLTRDSAKNIMMPVLKEVAEKHSLDVEFKESPQNLECVMPLTGSSVKLFGADQKNFVERLRGIKTPFAAIDEGQSFRGHLEVLVDDILTPAISDFESGQIVLTGTPAPVPKGYFYECTQGRHGFKVFNWTVYDNPYMPRSRQFVQELMEKKNWTENHPTYRREWLGEWVADIEALVYKFNPGRNTIPEVPGSDYYHVLGVDLGFYPDPSAFVLCAFNQYDKRLFVKESKSIHKLDVSSVAEIIKGYLKQYPTAQVIMDCGAQGKMISEEIRARFAIPIHAADKNGKAGFIEIMNSDFENGIIKLHSENTKELQEELSTLIWDAEKSARVEDSRYPNHCADGLLYAWRHCYNYAAKPEEKPRVKSETEKMDDWWDTQQNGDANEYI